MKELNVEAVDSNLNQVIDFVDEQLEQYDVPMKTMIQVQIAVEEIFVNICHYAYDSKVGSATIRAEVHENPLSVMLTFVDNGVPYDPLAKEDPDITLAAEDRKIGGLGIFMVKKSMDDVAYEYREGQNILTIKKNL